MHKRIQIRCAENACTLLPVLLSSHQSAAEVSVCVFVCVSMLYTSIYIYSRSPPILRCWHFNLMQFYWFYSNGKIEYINLDTSIYAVLHMHCMAYTIHWTQRDAEWSERKKNCSTNNKVSRRKYSMNRMQIYKSKYMHPDDDRREERKNWERNCHPKQLISVRYGVCNVHAYYFLFRLSFVLFSNEIFLRAARLLLLLPLLSSAVLTFLARRSFNICVLNLRLRSINRGNAKKDVGFFFLSLRSVRLYIEFRESTYWIWHILSLTYSYNLFMHLFHLSTCAIVRRNCSGKGTQNATISFVQFQVINLINA